jgi:hypothetical protein
MGFRLLRLGMTEIKMGMRKPKYHYYKDSCSWAFQSEIILKGNGNFFFLLFHLEELLKLIYVNLFYRFCVTLLFLEIFE